MCMQFAETKTAEFHIKTKNKWILESMQAEFLFSSLKSWLYMKGVKTHLIQGIEINVVSCKQTTARKHLMFGVNIEHND